MYYIRKKVPDPRPEKTGFLKQELPVVLIIRESKRTTISIGMRIRESVSVSVSASLSALT